MKRLALVLFLIPLSSCSRDQDGFKPRIVIEQPEAGMVSATGNTTVKGYAFDDRGVQRIEVNGKALYVAPQTAANVTNKGERIRPFEFKTGGSGEQLSYVIKVTDVGGLSSSKELPLTVDLQKPTLEIVKAERRNSVSRISGVASDNQKVRSILVDGSALDLKPAPKREFYIEVPQARVTITVLDAVGNKLTRTIGPLPELAPPPPPPDLTAAGTPATDATPRRFRSKRSRAATTGTAPSTVPDAGPSLSSGAP